jgi:RNA polymerase sigma-70 factor (ECF subfamily)
MLGSLVEAEDLLQETLIAACRGLEGFLGRSSMRTWLYRIATNRCLNAIRDGKRRAPPEPIPPFDPPPPSRRSAVTWLQPYPDGWLREAADQQLGPAERYLARETVELAFIETLQLLPPRQTAALLLCDVLGFATADAAGMLDTSPAAVKGALQRARASLARTDRNAAPRAADRHEEALAQRFARAFAADDIDGVIELLTDDAWLAMPPAPHEYHGPAAIAAFLRASADSRVAQHIRLAPTRANAQPAFGCYFVDLDRSKVTATGLIVLTTVNDGISVITRFLDNDLPRLFGLATPSISGHREVRRTNSP